MSTPKESLVIKSIVSISTHWIVTMLINFVIRDLSRILPTHQIVTMLIDSIIRDLSCILLTHRIVSMPINSVIKDLSRDVTHPSNPLNCSPFSHLMKSSHLLYWPKRPTRPTLTIGQPTKPTKPIGFVPMMIHHEAFTGLGLVENNVNQWSNTHPEGSWPVPTRHSHRAPRGICVLPTHMPLHGNNLHAMSKDPIAQSDLPYMGKEALRSQDFNSVSSP